MKRIILLIMALVSFVTLQAQWTDNPIDNNFIANCLSFPGEVYLSTNEATGDTYVQWTSTSSNGHGPTLQRLIFDGTPQWGTDGIRISGHNFDSFSQGFAMTSTADSAVVSCFATASSQTVAVKINADGTFSWGEQGVVLFNGNGFSRTELVAGDDGGVWALGFDYEKHYLQYINADGTLNPSIIVAVDGYNVMYGKLTLGMNNAVFLTYEQVAGSSGLYATKEIYLVGYNIDGTQIGTTVQLMSAQTFQITYLHHAVSDGMDGGYAYIWHPGIGGAFNTYVFHYDKYGNSTISDLNGTPVHTSDPSNFYLDAYGTVDPVSHDLIIAYRQTDAIYQSQSRVYVNRITPTGERVWGEGILVADNVGIYHSDIKVDAFEDGSGFSVIYGRSSEANPYFLTIEAVGMDINGNALWTKTLSSNPYSRAICENSAGFHFGQNVVAWVNTASDSLFAQNIGTDGTMGPIDPVIPCPAPKNLEGEYVYDEEAQQHGVQISWTAPEMQPLHYNLYRYDVADKEDIVIEVAGDATSYYDESGIGKFKYQLTAVHENCESDFALTPAGEDYIIVAVTSIEDEVQVNDQIVTIERIYNISGQCLNHNNLDELGNGIYILQGVTEDGKLVSRKIVVVK
ncbi:MAG TPA: hypothetical protein PKW37_07525 [Salinivirgaceae bacterium]|nr:hypothetical protein [Salinivirgaceae bacterium]